MKIWQYLAPVFVFMTFTLYIITTQLKLNSFITGKSDSSLYVNGLWLISQLKSPISLAYPGYRLNVYLGQHVMPIAFLYGLVFRPGFNLAWLSIVESASYAVGVLVMYYLFARRFGSALVGLVLAVVFWASYVPPPGHFYFENLAMPIAALGVYWMWRRQFTRATLAWFIFLLFKEYFAFTSMFAGIVIYFLSKRKFKGGILLAFVSILYFLSAFSIVMPWAQPKMQFLPLFSYLGSSVSEIIRNFLFAPNLWLGRLVDPVVVRYIIDLLIPFAFTALLAPEFLVMAIPLIGLNILVGRNHAVAEVGSHYSVAFLPILGGAGAIGLSRFYTWTHSFSPRTIAVRNIALITLIAVVAVAGIREHLYQLKISVRATSALSLHTVDVQAILKQIPERASVGATDQLMLYLATRPQVINLANLSYARPRYLVIDIGYNDCLSALIDNTMVVRGNFQQESCYTQIDWQNKFVASGAEQYWKANDYNPIFSKGSLILLENQIP